MANNKILLLTLVHPDFLPPVYATAQVLRDVGYDIHILTFESYVPAHIELGSNINVESVGRHHGISTMQRLSLRRKFRSRARQISSEGTIAIISFCPFSFKCGLSLRTATKPLLYIALEIADFRMKIFLKSPLSAFRNWQVLQNVHKADFVATPSYQRSAWLAGRCHLSFMPYTILNTSYIPAIAGADDTYSIFKELLPPAFLDKKIVLYTGAVNKDLCTLELVQAFIKAGDPGSALVITGLKDNPYCNGIRELVATSPCADRVQLFPYLTRTQMLALQANAHIGACLTREYQEVIKSKMIAPNKVGEYAAKNLYLLGIKNEYLLPFEMKGIASLSVSTDPAHVCAALKHALQAVADPGYRTRISNFVADYFSMQQQLQPAITYIKKISGA
jgi:hypothetical protein